jgi:heat shock protein HslJ
MKLPTSLLACALFLTISGCTIPSSEPVKNAATVPLVNTAWRLTQLGGQMISNPEGPAAIGLKLESQNPRVTGFAGCNRMFGGYSLNGDELKFDELGSTKMACVDQERMQLEMRYLESLTGVARWKITDSTLVLLDARGAPLVTFAATPAP